MGHPDRLRPWTQEHALISIYQPSLNWPHIYRRYKRISTGYTATRFLAEQPMVQVRQTPFPPLAQEELHSLWQELPSGGAQTHPSLVHHRSPHLGAH